VHDGSDVPAMRWWGWGDAAHRLTLPPHALSFLRGTVGLADPPRPPVALASVRVGPSALSEETLGALRAIVGDQAVRDGHAERVIHAAGKGYEDLVRLRAGEPQGAPDVVVLPGEHAQVRAVLALCVQDSLAVVPFGGGTSVVGGVAPLRGEHRGVVALDLKRLGGVLELDSESRTVTVQAGARAPALERYLTSRGLTLGHFPQSF
jgi:alkyldihydroxyacetonephosphate synthase